MKKAAKVVESNPDNLLTGEEISDLSKRLLDNYPARITRAFNTALQQETEVAKLTEIQHLIELFGLEIPAPIIPNPPITKDDVRLVCWMAVAKEETD